MAHIAPTLTPHNATVLEGTPEDALPCIAMARSRGFYVVYVVPEGLRQGRKNLFLENTSGIFVYSSLKEAADALGHQGDIRNLGEPNDAEMVHWWGIKEDMVLSGVAAITMALSRLKCIHPQGNVLEGASAFEDESEMDSWVDLYHRGGIDKKTLNEVLGEKKAMLKTLINMGVQHSPQQKQVVQEIISRIQKHDPLSQSLQKVEKKLESCRFLLGTEEPTAADMVLGTILLEPMMCLSGSNAYPRISDWIRRLSNNAYVHEALMATGSHTGGIERIGCQIDAKPGPKRVAQEADDSMRLNEGVKKSTAQRKGAKTEKTDTDPKKEETHTSSSNKQSAKEPTAEQRPENVAETEMQAASRLEKAESALKFYQIPYALHRHNATHTIAELLEATSDITGAIQVKNLFIKAKKAKKEGDSRLWLLVAKHDTPTDMKSLAQQLGYGNITLRFSDAKTLATNLGTTQGNVSPLALMNDTAQLVNVAIDRNLLDEGGPVLVHPLTNEASVELNIKDILSFIEQTGHTWVTVDF